MQRERTMMPVLKERRLSHCLMRWRSCFIGFDVVFVRCEATKVVLFRESVLLFSRKNATFAARKFLADEFAVHF